MGIQCMILDKRSDDAAMYSWNTVLGTPICLYRTLDRHIIDTVTLDFELVGGEMCTSAVKKRFVVQSDISGHLRSRIVEHSTPAC